ncbi:hypothetical protein Tco_1030090 [Tanacetum coccineum]|uniref:Uncharacterized protein n=1 Tax=Tanacetum coccineum TaxID=301880 RepID=A0ABQ5G6Z5_9ASTR
MDDPNITMEEYIRLEEEKSRRHGKVYNWETAMYDFEKEFLAIVYNDALTSKLDFLIEPTVSPQHIDEFNLKDETSLSECDEEEQNVLYFNDLFPFNVIYHDDSKSDKDNDDDKIDIKLSSRGNVINTDDGAYAHGLVDTAYSLNEYSIFDTGINMAYLVVWIRRIDFMYSFRTLLNEDDEFGGVLINLEMSKCWSLEISRRLFNTSLLRLEKEKARRRGKVYNWETTTYGKIWYNEDVHDLRSVETEFPAIVLNDALTYEVTLSCEPTVSSLNDKINFRISFDKSDDEDYTMADTAYPNLMDMAY